MWSRQVKGSGSPMLCLHGWGQTHQNLETLAALLTCSASPILFDLPGFGRSPPPPAVWSADDYANHLASYMTENNIEKASFLGHSFGGKIALCFAEKYPEKIDRLILMAPSGLKPKLSLAKKLRRLGIRTSARFVKAYDRAFGKTIFNDVFTPRFGSSDYQNAGAMRPILVKSVNEDISSKIKSIQCPTLLLWGRKDMETPLEIGERMHRLIAGSKLCIFPHHDHYLCNDVGAHLMADYILDFLRESL
ncbi:alpha/beta fold hydrolase [Waddlia chondrophila]|nr:alpha/beta hydrolase [Waddlia chondrophila]